MTARRRRLSRVACSKTMACQPASHSQHVVMPRQCAAPAATPASATRRASRRCRQASTSCLRSSIAACRRWAEHSRTAAWMGAAACCGRRSEGAEARCVSCWLLGCLLPGPGIDAVHCRRRVPAPADVEDDPLLLRERGGGLRLPPLPPAAGQSKGGRRWCVLLTDQSLSREHAAAPGACLMWCGAGAAAAGPLERQRWPLGCHWMLGRALEPC
jgi:hypothetical protein